MRRHSRSQAVVEFGIIALLFTLLIFAVVDFGLLLNTWLAVSNGSRELARSASVGKNADFLLNEAQALNLPSVNGGSCCDASSAVEVKVEYFMGSMGGGRVPAMEVWLQAYRPNVDQFSLSRGRPGWIRGHLLWFKLPARV